METGVPLSKKGVKETKNIKMIWDRVRKSQYLLIVIIFCNVDISDLLQNPARYKNKIYLFVSSSNICCIVHVHIWSLRTMFSRSACLSFNIYILFS